MAYVSMQGAKLYKLEEQPSPWTVNLMRNEDNEDLLVIVGSPDINKKMTVFKDSSIAEFNEILWTMIYAINPEKIRRWVDDGNGNVRYEEEEF